MHIYSIYSIFLDGSWINNVWGSQIALDQWKKIGPRYFPGNFSVFTQIQMFLILHFMLFPNKSRHIIQNIFVYLYKLHKVFNELF